MFTLGLVGILSQVLTWRENVTGDVASEKTDTGVGLEFISS